MFSKACKYGIKAAIFIAQESQKGHRVSLKVIAKAIDSPIAFTAKILQALAKHGIINSVHGPTGGYEISIEQQRNIMLYQIVETIDGDQIYEGCALGLKSCNASKPCPLHDEFAIIRDKLKSMLQQTSLEKLTNGLDQGLTFLKQ